MTLTLKVELLILNVTFHLIDIGQTNTHTNTYILGNFDITLTFIWPWPTLSYFSIFLMFFYSILNLNHTHRSNTYDLTDMLDDFDMTLTFIWPWPRIPLHKQTKLQTTSDATPCHALALISSVGFITLFNNEVLNYKKKLSPLFSSPALNEV